MGLPPLLALALGAAFACGQGPQPDVTRMAARAGEILREIDDPHSGERWLLVRDAAHPVGPGLLLLAGGGVQDTSRNGNVPSRPSAPADPPVIRSGERVVVVENTPAVEARLEAVALNPAWRGSTLNVRLSIGGRVMRVTATGAGTAAFQDEVAPALPPSQSAPAGREAQP